MARSGVTSAALLALWAMMLPAQRPARPAAPKTSVSTAGSADLESTLGLRFGAPRPIRTPADEEATLPNGVRVTASENREIPIVNLLVLVAAGSAIDPEGKAGLAEITATVVRRGGTASLTATELQERFEQLGASLESSTADSFAQFWLRAPAATFAEAASILRDLVTAPRLDPEAVDDALAAMHELIGRRNLDPAAGLTRVFRRRLFGPASPWARLPDYDSLDNISRTDIESLHARRYVPASTLVAVEGDITRADAKAKVQALFGGWAAAGAARPQQEEAGAKPVTAPQPTESSVQFADRDDLRFGLIVLGHQAGRLGDADYAAMQVLCDVLDSPTDGRLAARVRASGGWRADWNAAWEAAYDRPGEFTVRATLEQAYTTQAVAIIRDELTRIREGGITEQEVERARTRMLTRLALRYQSTAEQARDRAVARFHGQPADLFVRAYQNLATLTAADVSRAAARNLPAYQVVAAVGNSRLFDKPLATLGMKVEEVELTQQSARPLKPRTDAQSLEKGRQALARMQEAMGGRARLAAVRDMSIRQEGTTLLGDRMSDVKLWDRWMHDDIYRQDQEFGTVQRSIFYNGKIAWLGTRGTVAPLPSQMVPLVRNEIFRLLFRLALSDQIDSRQVADLGGNVLQITEGAEHGVRVYLDPATSLPQRLLYRIDLGGGVTVSADDTFSAFKEFDGIKWPTRIVSKKNGRRSDELTVVDAKFNSGLKTEDLERKP